MVRAGSHEESLAEAQEFIEAFNRSLLALDGWWQGGARDKRGALALIDQAFRAVHSLKGLSALVGGGPLGEVAHTIENLLDRLRLDRQVLTPEVLDVLFDATAVLQQLLGEGDGRPLDVAGFVERTRHLCDPGTPAAESAQLDVSALGLSALTEFEEHRLRENLRAGRPLFRLRLVTALTELEAKLADLRRRVEPLGEPIAHWVDAAPDGHVYSELLFALAGEEPALANAMPAGGEILPFDVGPTPRAEAAPRPAEVTTRVRVDIARIDRLLAMVGELGQVQAAIEHAIDRRDVGQPSGEWARLLRLEGRELKHKLVQVQDAILSMRMVPLGPLFEKLARVVRKISREEGKPVDLSIDGAHVEIDRRMVEELSDPLLHLVRNCLAHGIESPAERRAAGKPERGRLTLGAVQRGGRVVITIADDGRGLDDAWLVEGAIRAGHLTPTRAAALSSDEIRDLMFLPGVTSQPRATELSGRGVGMDVVRNNVARLSGAIDVASEAGRGTRFMLSLPMTLAILEALVVRIGAETYCLPLGTVLESVRLADDGVTPETDTARLGGTPMLRIEDAFRRPRRATPPRYMVVVGSAGQRVGLSVDDLVGKQDIVVRPLAGALGRASLRGITGAADLGDGATALVLDVVALAERASRSTEEAR